MSKFTNKNFFASLQNAFRGIFVAFKSQRNFKYQLTIMLLILIIAIIFDYSAVELCLALFTIAFVLVCEIFNSVIEFSLDSMYRNKYSILVKMAKDLAAGGVLVASLTCALINLILLVANL